MASMDFFDCRYYSLNRKLLILIGQWPYYNGIGRTAKHICIVCVALLICITQVAKLLSSQFDINVIFEVVAAGIVTSICVIKFFTFSIQAKKIKLLLESVKSDWNSLNNADDRKIAGECAEEGRKYIFFIVVMLYSSVVVTSISFGLQPLLKKILWNETYVNVLIYPAEYFVDSDKYYYPILLHMIFNILVGVTIVLATDTIYIACVYHACGMFKIISHRLEHIFDNNKQDESDIFDANTQISLRIASAVKYHCSTIEYTDIIISTFEMELCITIILVFCNISVTLFCTVMSLETLSRMLIYAFAAIAQMIHVLVIAYPCQKMVDYSSTIPFNAYCGQWYTAPFKLQSLLLLIIQRGAKPTIISVAKILMITFETYAAAIQLSLSYFTVLLSFS